MPIKGRPTARSLCPADKIRRMTELAETYETVNLHRREGAAIIELNRPETMNAWNKQFGLDLRAAVDHCASDDESRAFCITGPGRGCSSGPDLRAMDNHAVTPEGKPDVRKRLTEDYHPI